MAAAGSGETIAGLADTTRTTLDNCFVGLATGLVGLISDFNAASDTGFVSITGATDDGAGSVVVTAFGASIIKNKNTGEENKKHSNKKNRKRKRNARKLIFFSGEKTKTDSK